MVKWPGAALTGEDVERAKAALRCFAEEPLRPKVGLALAGGAARGIAHLGVLYGLRELGVPIDYIAGASAGAIAGAALAADIDLHRLLELVMERDWWFMLKPAVFEGRGGVLSSVGIERWIERWLGNKEFSELVIPLAMVAADLQTGERVILRHGSVARAARISSTVPGLYAPIKTEEGVLADGGMICNLPVDVVKDMGAEIVIAVDLNAQLCSGPLRSFSEVVSQAILVVQRTNERLQLAQADLVIQPDLSRHSLVDFDAAEPLIEAGIQAVKEQVPALLALLGLGID